MKKLLAYILIFSSLIIIGSTYFARSAFAEMACRYHEGADGVPQEGEIVNIMLDGQNASHDKEACDIIAAGTETQARGQVYWGEAPQAKDFGVCTQKDNVTGHLLVFEHMTKKACLDSANADNGTTFISWSPDEPSPQPKDQGSGAYVLLSPLPCPKDNPNCPTGRLESYDPTQDNNFSGYVTVIIIIFIGGCGVAGVVIIVIAGMEYATSELTHTKEHAKERIVHVFFGLVLAGSAWTILYEINPDLLIIDLPDKATVTVTLDEQIKSYTGRGKCEPITSGPCSPSNLTQAGFSNGTQASSICNAESAGNPNLASGVDKCSDGTSFSYGLFQVNILAHANEIPGGVCSNIFETRGGGTQGTCLESKSGICIRYDCSVKNRTKLQSCVNYITNTTNNINYALGLQRARGWGQWGANASCHF